MPNINEQLALSAGLTTKTNQLCIGLESGVADIFELVVMADDKTFYEWRGKGAQLGGTGGLLSFSRVRPTAAAIMQRQPDM